ncbi:MAG: M48 family metalloprotease [Pseudomonadota bacterium]|nr:M48 family metalloprotease [Pseudomonadota bacterium]
MRLTLIPLALVTALSFGCSTVTNPVSGLKERTVMNEQAEMAQGKKAHEQVLEEYSEYKNPELQAYVNDIGQRLAKHSHRSNIEWHFTVLDSPEVNAFATPGGYVYITRGIMAYMDSEADLAGVIGHEIGHVTARHASQRATREQKAGLGVIAATVLGAILESRGVGGAGQAVSQASQGLAAGFVSSYSRDQELQADKLGAEYLARADYNPKNMVDVIQVLKNQEQFAQDSARLEGHAPPPQAGWLASHPSNDQRLREITQIASTYKSNYGDDSRTRYLQAINGLVFGESREQGVTRGTNFYHEPLGFALTAPPGWKIQNSASSLTFVNPDGNAGLSVNVVPPQAGNTHEEIIRNVLKPDQGNADRLSINGLPATHFIGTRKDQQAQLQPVEVTVVSGPLNKNYLLVYASKDAQSRQQAYRAMQQIESSFRPMTEADRVAARPWSLKSVAYPPGGFTQLARQSPLTNNPERQFRLINGVYAGGEPQVGQIIKIVE